MSKDGYYQPTHQSGSKNMDGLSLPSLPPTTYWYDAHTTVNTPLYPATDALTPTHYKAHHVETKIAERDRDSLEWWTDSMCMSNDQRTIDPQYWGGQPSKRGYVPPPYERMEAEVHPPEQAMTMLKYDAADMEYMNVGDAGRSEPDERSVCCDSLSSQGFSPTSSNSDNLSMQKTSPEPYAGADDPKRCQKRQRKEAKEKAKDDKRCGVCGDAARSMHFGGMACDSCKAFFRRSVQSGAFKTFTCPESENCPISKTNRKVCQFCRFKKSQENGMEISWVMSETDRMVLWKNRLAKQRHVQEEKIKERKYGSLPRSLDPEEADKLKSLTALQENTFSSIPYPDDCYGDTVEALANLFVCICKKLGMFFYKVEEFQTVCKNDQSLLLKNGIGMSIYLHGAYMYDTENKTWPAESNKEALKIPPVTLETLRKFTVIPEAFDAIMKFYNKYAREVKDEIILSLISVVAFFQPDDPQFRDPTKIQDIQLKYLAYLRHYLQAKEGDSGVRVTFPKLLVGLADVKEILEFHSRVDIKPTINHQKINTHSSVKYQISSVSEMFPMIYQRLLPEFASILSDTEQRSPVWQQSSAVSKGKQVKASAVLRSEQFYHPLTNQMFGRDPRTDMIISNPIDQLDRTIRKHWLPPANISDVTDQEKPTNYRDLKRRILHAQSEKVSTSEENSKRQQMLVPAHGYWDLNDYSAAEKKRVVEVLCDVMQQISCSDNVEFVQSLKQTLSPHLLSNLAQKLSS
ncbi:Oxysterols receptor LXR-alpha [Chionoecetes opilio]|uniref:Oxysterols receptor LXR-alpha n=1 Tax=Chionoecetes opilio TaxID=41210 RepID=A0A8J4YUW0_CHIOP|nr:Oxysterols receptor LXR-alpha [Chionoecetes opilio]